MSRQFIASIVKLCVAYLALIPLAVALETPTLGQKADIASNQQAVARIALVIGNSDYAQKPLVSPVKDAQTVAKQLGQLGFHVIVQENTRAEALQQSLQEFSTLLHATKGVGLFYYAGHGVQVDGTNYLIPVDVDLRQAQSVLDYSLSLSQVLDHLGNAGNQTNIVIIDACRDNPFSERGLAPLSYNSTPGNTFIAFATAPGNVAIDGDDNGLFTEHLLAHMDTPSQPIEQLFKKVRQDVMNDSQGKQIPWEHSSLTGDFYFNPPNLVAVKAASTEAVAQASGIAKEELLAVAANSPFLKVDPSRLQLGPALVRSSATRRENIAEEIDRYMHRARVYLGQDDIMEATRYLEKAFTLSHKASLEQIQALTSLYNSALAKQ